jgi:hypothetical protein
MPKRTKDPDPDRLVRESAGSYRTEDGRFTVRSSGGAGRWYVSDSERRDQLGMELVIGPFETLDEVRPAIAAQRNAPEDTTPPIPPDMPDSEPAARPSGRRRARAAASEPEAAPPPPEPEHAARPAVRTQLARWRKRADQRDDVAAALRRISIAWTGAQPDQMEDDLDPGAVFVQPGLENRAEGRDAAIASYRQFMESSLVHDYEEHDLRIDVVGTAAVATFGFRIEWESDGERHVDRGHDLFVFARSDDRWKAVWRTLMVEEKATE